MKPLKRRKAQAALEALGWRTVDTGQGYFLLPADQVKHFDASFVKPLGHPGRLPKPFPTL